MQHSQIKAPPGAIKNTQQGAPMSLLSNAVLKAERALVSDPAGKPLVRAYYHMWVVRLLNSRHFGSLSQHLNAH